MVRSCSKHTTLGPFVLGSELSRPSSFNIERVMANFGRRSNECVSCTRSPARPRKCRGRREHHTTVSFQYRESAGLVSLSTPQLHRHGRWQARTSGEAAGPAACEDQTFRRLNSASSRQAGFQRGACLTPETITRLLASMNAGRLLVVCGAGLSMAPPSSLPSAREVAERCFDKYRLESDPTCNLVLRNNLEVLAEHFASLSTLQSVFIEHLVPWPAFVRPSNTGHAAIADFLITRAAVAGISSNCDTLIERRAWDYGADFRGSLDGDEAIADSVRQAPLLKFHGCSHRDRLATVWAPS